MMQTAHSPVPQGQQQQLQQVPPPPPGPNPSLQSSVSSGSLSVSSLASASSLSSTSSAGGGSRTSTPLSKKPKTKFPKVFQCTGYGDCKMTFTRSEHLARHIRKHTGERPFRCHCNRTFSRLDNLRQHIQTVHANEHHILHAPPPPPLPHSNKVGSVHDFQSQQGYLYAQQGQGQQPGGGQPGQPGQQQQQQPQQFPPYQRMALSDTPPPPPPPPHSAGGGGGGGPMDTSGDISTGFRAKSRPPPIAVPGQAGAPEWASYQQQNVPPHHYSLASPYFSSHPGQHPGPGPSSPSNPPPGHHEAVPRDQASAGGFNNLNEPGIRAHAGAGPFGSGPGGASSQAEAAAASGTGVNFRGIGGGDSGAQSPNHTLHSSRSMAGLSTSTISSSRPASSNLSTPVSSTTSSWLSSVLCESTPSDRNSQLPPVEERPHTWGPSNNRYSSSSGYEDHGDRNSLSQLVRITEDAHISTPRLPSQNGSDGNPSALPPLQSVLSYDPSRGPPPPQLSQNRSYTRNLILPRPDSYPPPKGYPVPLPVADTRPPTLPPAGSNVSTPSSATYSHSSHKVMNKPLPPLPSEAQQQQLQQQHQQQQPQQQQQQQQQQGDGRANPNGEGMDALVQAAGV